VSPRHGRKQGPKEAEVRVMSLSEVKGVGGVAGRGEVTVTVVTETWAKL